jgi:hypothetical protein
VIDSLLALPPHIEIHIFVFLVILGRVNRHSISICFLRKGKEDIKKGETNNRESRERSPIASSKLKHEKYMKVTSGAGPPTS